MKRACSLGLVLLVALTVASRAMAVDHASVQAHPSAYGTVLFDGRGFALYAFTADSATRSRCSAACARSWPPFLVNGKPVAAKGTAQRLLGRIRRTDGRYQVTYRGHPLYYYVGDRRQGQILCQDVVEFGGRWLVVSPSGTLVR